MLIDKPAPQTVSIDELVAIAELQAQLVNIFPSMGSLEWELRQHRQDYVAGGALFVIGRRLLAHPATFKRIALAIGARKAGSVAA